MTGLSPGVRIGPYSLVRPLGRGGFGEVWLGERDSQIAKTYLALKLPLADAVDTEQIRREAQLWVRAANHPNVLPIFEANVYDGRVVIASEYAADGSLSDWLTGHRGRAPSVESAVDMTMAILSGLEHLHVRGIIHRDLKPGNVLMQGGAPRLADFGLARRIDTEATRGVLSGTPAYMAPEAFDARRSVQTDIWAVGVMLYQLLAGRLPFDAKELVACIKLILSSAPEPLPATVPPAIAQAVARALNKSPEARFPSAADMRAVLRDAMRRAGPETSQGAAGLRGGSLTIAVTGTMRAEPHRVLQRLRALAMPYCLPSTTWYCGTSGGVDETAVQYLLEERQRVVAVGYGPADVSPTMRALLKKYDVPFVDAQHEDVPPSSDAPSRRDVFFLTKADFMLVLWDGKSQGTRRLLQWMHQKGKDHLVAFVA